MIVHTVAFKLKHPAGSAAEADFLRAALVLTTLPTVRHFEQRRQVSRKSDFDFGFSMAFASPADYEAYNRHPEHVRFVEERWKPEVVAFIELDYVALEPA